MRSVSIIENDLRNWRFRHSRQAAVITGAGEGVILWGYLGDPLYFSITAATVFALTAIRLRNAAKKERNLRIELSLAKTEELLRL